MGRRLFMRQLVLCIVFFFFNPMRWDANVHAMEIEVLTTKDGLAQNAIRSIVKDSKGYMWFGTWNGLCRYDGYEFKTYRAVPGDSTSLPYSRVHRLYVDTAGTLWVTTFNYWICRYNVEKDAFDRYRRSELSGSLKLNTERVVGYDIIKDIPGDVLQALGDFQLSNTQEHLIWKNPPEGIRDVNINCMFYDPVGLLWVGTASGGVHKVDLTPSRFTVHSIDKQSGRVQANAVRAMWTDYEGVWLGTQNAGLLRVNCPESLAPVGFSATAHLNVRGLYRDRRQRFWLACLDGLYRFNVETNDLTRLRVSTGRADERFTSIVEDPSGACLWIGGYKGLYRYVMDRDELEWLDGALRRNANVTDLHFDSDGNLWVATEYAGVTAFLQPLENGGWVDTLRFQATGSAFSLPDNRVYSVANDFYGNVWFGTANGLCRYDLRSGKLRTFGQADGMSDLYCTQIDADDSLNVWVSHKKGISKIDVDNFTIHNFSIRSSGYEFVESSGCVDMLSGTFYRGGVSGYVVFHPDSIRIDSRGSKVELTHLEVLNKERIVPRDGFLRLSNRDRSFSLTFSALSYIAPSKLMYAYFLEGYDTDWTIQPATRRVVSYSNLPAGTYEFRVKASNADGVWGKDETRLTIVVLPPWWRTNWAYLLFFLCTVGLLWYVYVAIRARYRRVKTNEMNAIRTHFFTGISHEIRTPLTLLIDPIDRLVGGRVEERDRLTMYGLMQQNAHRLLALINQLLDFRKLESGGYRLYGRRADVVGFVRQITGLFELQAESKSLEFRFHSESDAHWFVFDEDALQKVLSNLISNAIRHSVEGGVIELHLKDLTEERIVCKVVDHGQGFDPLLAGQLFDPYMQARKQTTNSSGLGLSLCKELVEAHGGSIRASCEPGIETIFEFEMGAIPCASSLSEDNVRTESMPVVLIVEDDADVRHYLEILMRDDYNVLTACNGQAGLQLALKEVPDIVLSDVDMPEMDGFKLCAQLKSSYETSHIPVILLTAMQETDSKISGYDIGADAYVVKPFESNLLLVRMRNLLNSRQQLRRLFGKDPSFDPMTLAVNEADRAFMKLAVGQVELHLDDAAFGVDQLASALNTSRTPLYRKIKAMTGQTVYEFITTIRLNKAAELLRSETLKIAEIADRTGFSTPGNFSRSFVRQFGQTPSAYAAGKVRDD